MKILVGVPVFRVPELVERCIMSLKGTPADILVVDNAADAEVKLVLRRHDDSRQFKRSQNKNPSIKVITTEVNTYCNGAWNVILDYGINNGYDIVALGSSDVVLKTGWYQALVNRAEKFNDEVWVPSVESAPINCEVQEYNLGGFFNFLPRKAAELVYPIPRELRHWFGDTYMFNKLREKGWKICVLGSIVAHHEQSAITVRVPEAYEVIEQDKEAWSKYQNKGGTNE